MTKVDWIKVVCADGYMTYLRGKRLPKVERIQIEKEHGKILSVTNVKA